MTALSGMNPVVGGIVAVAVSLITKFFADTVESPAELEAELTRTYDAKWEECSRALDTQIREIGARIQAEIRSRMTEFMKDMRAQLDDIRAVSPEELQLFDEMRQESHKALELLDRVLRDTAVNS